jgi:hypothetical protein
MASLLGIVIPLALGAAISPTILAVQLVTLSRTTAPLRRAWSLAAGCAPMLAGYSALALLVAKSTGGSSSPCSAGAIVKLVAAALLIALTARNLRRPEQPTKPEHAGAHPARQSFVFGVGLMLLNFSSILLYFPAAHEVGTSKVTLTGKVVVFALLYVIALLPAFGPPLVVTLLGARATPLLERLNRFFAVYRRAIGAGICLAFAALLTVAGLRVLF